MPLERKLIQMKRAATATVEKNSGIYVLQLKNTAMYYVGTSENIERRVNAHRLGNGSAWCRKHGGVNARMPILDGRSELDETITTMLVYGFENVRGWEFSGCAQLSVAELDTVVLYVCCDTILFHTDNNN